MLFSWFTDNRFVCICDFFEGFFGCLMIEFDFCWRVVIDNELFFTGGSGGGGGGGGGLRLCFRRSTRVDDGGFVICRSAGFFCRKPLGV